MALRELVDSRGTIWQVWIVHPTTRYSSPLARAERRRRRSGHHFPERRKEALSSLAPGLEGGWLCFECAEERRRLIPAPANWATCPEEELRRFLAAAKPVGRRASPTGATRGSASQKETSTPSAGRTGNMLIPDRVGSSRS